MSKSFSKAVVSLLIAFFAVIAAAPAFAGKDSRPVVTGVCEQVQTRYIYSGRAPKGQDAAFLKACIKEKKISQFWIQRSRVLQDLAVSVQ